MVQELLWIGLCVTWALAGGVIWFFASAPLKLGKDFGLMKWWAKPRLEFDRPPENLGVWRFRVLVIACYWFLLPIGIAGERFAWMWLIAPWLLVAMMSELQKKSKDSYRLFKLDCAALADTRYEHYLEWLENNADTTSDNWKKRVEFLRYHYDRVHDRPSILEFLTMTPNSGRWMLDYYPFKAKSILVGSVFEQSDEAKHHYVDWYFLHHSQASNPS